MYFFITSIRDLVVDETTFLEKKLTLLVNKLFLCINPRGY